MPQIWRPTRDPNYTCTSSQPEFSSKGTRRDHEIREITKSQLAKIQGNLGSRSPRLASRATYCPHPRRWWPRCLLEKTLKEAATQGKGKGREHRLSAGRHRQGRKLLVSTRRAANSKPASFLICLSHVSGELVVGRLGQRQPRYCFINPPQGTRASSNFVSQIALTVYQ